MTDIVLMGLVVALLAVLVIVQLLSARAARTIGGRSSRGVVALRVINAVAVMALIIWLLVSRSGG